METWDKFIVDFNDNISPIYENNEKIFDQHDIHGRNHISRTLFFGEFMYRFYESIGIKNIDINAIRYSISYHDSGRKGNGKDLWEKNSSEICKNNMIEKYDYEYSLLVSNIILKDDLDNSIEKIIFKDADMIDIMRPCCGHGGLYGFNSNRLSFLKDKPEYKHIRENFILEAWQLIKETEENKHIFKDNYIENILFIIKSNKYKYDLFNRFF